MAPVDLQETRKLNFVAAWRTVGAVGGLGQNETGVFRRITGTRERFRNLQINGRSQHNGMNDLAAMVALMLILRWLFLRLTVMQALGRIVPMGAGLDDSRILVRFDRVGNIRSPADPVDYQGNQQ